MTKYLGILLALIIGGSCAALADTATPSPVPTATPVQLFHNYVGTAVSRLSGSFQAKTYRIQYDFVGHCPGIIGGAEEMAVTVSLFDAATGAEASPTQLDVSMAIDGTHVKAENRALNAGRVRVAFDDKQAKGVCGSKLDIHTSAAFGTTSTVSADWSDTPSGSSAPLFSFHIDLH